MKTISESITTMESAIPTLQDQIMYNHFENGAQPIVFQDAIIKNMDLTPPMPPAVSTITTPQINNNIMPQVQYTQQPQSSIPVLDLKPIDPYSLYYTEPALDPSSDENIENNIKILSTYFSIDEEKLIKGKDTYTNQHMINALEILKSRILNEKKVLSTFIEFIRKFNINNDESKRLKLYYVDEFEGNNVLFFFDDKHANVKYMISVFDTSEIQCDTSQDGKKFYTNQIQFYTLPY